MLSRKANRTQASTTVPFVVTPAFNAKQVLVGPAVTRSIRAFLMMRQMDGCRSQLQILKAIIQFVVVNVVDNFWPYKSPSDMLFHYPSVKIDYTAPNWEPNTKISRFFKPWFWRPLCGELAPITASSVAIRVGAFRAIFHSSSIPYYRAT